MTGSNVYCQQRLWSRSADRGGGLFGWDHEAYRDVDGDGVIDYLVSELGSWCAGSGTGAVHLVSGASGAELDQICDSYVSGDYGSSLAVMDDLDGDGVAEFAIGSSHYGEPVPGSDAGAVFVYSGASKSLIYRLISDLPFAHMGRRIATIADVDGDGFHDLLVGSPQWESFNLPGRADVYSAKTSALLRTYYGVDRDEQLGSHIASVGDVDADDVCDYAVGAIRGGASNRVGRVAVFSAATGAEILRWDGPGTDSGFGNCIVDLGDYDSDGHDDLLIGAYNVGGIGIIYAYSGATGDTLFELRTNLKQDAFAASFALVGDMNGDGQPEILANAHFDDHVAPDAGAAYLFSGKTQRPLYCYHGAFKENLLGWRVGGGQDLDGDGIPDGLVGVQHDTKVGGVFGPEWMFAFAGNDLFLQASATSVLVGDDVTLETRGGEPGALTLLVLTDVSGTPFFLPLLVTTLDGFGESAFTATVPAAALGLDLTMVAYAQKHAGGRGIIDSGKETIAVR